MPAAQFPRHTPAVTGCADVADGGRDWAHPTGEQQRLLPGQRDLLGGLETGPAAARAFAVHALVDSVLPPTPGVAPPSVLPRAEDPRLGSQRPVVVPAG